MVAGLPAFIFFDIILVTMEKDKNAIVTFENLVKYTEEVLFPGFEEMMDEKLGNFEVKMDKKFVGVDKKFESVDKNFESINQHLVNIHAELSDIKNEISAIKGELNYIKVKLDRLEKMVEGDSKMYISEIAELKKANEEITKRLIILENKRV